MWVILLCFAALSSVQGQYVKTGNYGVKGGVYRGDENVVRFFNNNTEGHGYYSPPVSDVGVCYIEVPTASLVRDPAHVPTGNGSQPHLSRIRSCCKGYIRNIHNHLLCDPVCSTECINALCTAPEVCSCYPDHVKNQAGICVPTCPIGCQNGYCAGGECICNSGFKLDRDSKYCLPSCRQDCGPRGNCTAPDTCSCESGYESGPGGCKPVCNPLCDGDCVAPNQCQCRHGYTRDSRGSCIPQCPQGCGPTGKCTAPNVCSDQTTTTSRPYISNPSNIPTQNLYPYNQQNPSSSQRPYQPIYPNPYGQDSQFPQGQSQPGTYHPGVNQPGYPYNPNSNYSGPGTFYPGSNGSPFVNNPYAQYPGSNPNLPSNNNSQGSNGQSNHGMTYYHTDNQYGYNFTSDSQTHQANSTYQSNYRNDTYSHNPYPNYPGSVDQNHGTHYPDNQQHYPGSYSDDRLKHTGSSYLDSYNQQYPGNSYPSPAGLNSSYPIPSYPNPILKPGDVEMVPNCQMPCINGVCVEGNRCACNPGYVIDDVDPSRTRCRPHCPGGCTNGVCSAPNFCICNLGFRKEQGVKGRPAQCVKRIR